MVSSKRIVIGCCAVLLLGGVAFVARARAQGNLPSLPMLLSGAATGLHNVGNGYLGIDLRSLNDPTVSSLHLREAHGVVVVMVDHDGPAWKAGVREHDVVVSVNGTAVDSEDQLRRMLRELQPGRAVQMVVSRDGATQQLNATMADRDEIGKKAWEQHWVVPAPEPVVSDDSVPPPAPQSRPSSHFGHGLMSGHILPTFPTYTGATVDEVGPQLAEFFGMKDGKGLLVHSIDTNSPAAAAGLHAGDVVLRVNGSVVATRTDWNRALHDGKGHPVSLVVMREHREQTLTMVPDKHRGALDGTNDPAPQKPRWLAVLLLH